MGFDEELQWHVAIKVPTPERFQKPEDAEAYLAEARTVAGLYHPHIVPVYDVGRSNDGSSSAAPMETGRWAPRLAGCCGAATRPSNNRSPLAPIGTAKWHLAGPGRFR